MTTAVTGRDGSTPYAGANRVRFEGLRLPALSAPFRRSPVDGRTLHRPQAPPLLRRPTPTSLRDLAGIPSKITAGGGGVVGGGAGVGEDGGVLRSLRGPDGGPSRGVRLLTVVVVVALVAGSATVLLPVLGWLVDLL